MIRMIAGPKKYPIGKSFSRYLNLNLSIGWKTLFFSSLILSALSSCPDENPFPVDTGAYCCAFPNSKRDAAIHQR